MAKYVPIRAIERLKEQLEHGGGIASAEPPIISAQADYLVALSGGLALDEIRIRRILPLAVFISDETKTASFQTLAEIVINDLVPALDAEFINVPLAEVGSIGWRPTIRTNQRYTLKEQAVNENIAFSECRNAIRMLAARERYEVLKSNLEETERKLKETERKLKVALKKAEVFVTPEADTNAFKAQNEHEQAIAAFALRKAEFEVEKAKYEKQTALIEAFSKLAQALLKIAASCVVIVGSLHIFSHKAHPDDPHYKIHVERKSASEAYESWSDEISEVLKKLAEGLASEKDK